MNNVIPHLVTGKTLSIMLERIGRSLIEYDELLDVASKAQVSLGENALLKLALQSEGSAFLKATLVCNELFLRIKEIEVPTKNEQGICACLATAMTDFLGYAKLEIDVDDRTDLELSADAMLFSIIEKPQ